MAVRVPLLEAGKLQARLDDLIATKGDGPWSDTMMLSDNMQARGHRKIVAVVSGGNIDLAKFAELTRSAERA